MGKQNNDKGKSNKINITGRGASESRKEEPLSPGKAEFDYNKLKSTFISNISHEIRTPLNAILGFSELSMLNGADLKELHEYMSIIHESSKDLLQKIKDIIYLSSLDSGMISYSPDAISMNGLMKELLDYFQYIYPKAANGKVEIDVSLKHTHHFYFESDAAKLVDVLKRLMSNAVKFTDKGKVELLYTPTDRNEICFTVKDTGIGIPEEKLDMIFEPFATAQDIYNRKYSGSGLGLAIVKHLVKLMNGRLEINSTVGEGTQVKVIIPYTQIKNPEQSGKQ